MSYDHHKKAGNEGDLPKHVALIAALDETVSRTDHRPFRYADIFAGYAESPVREGEGEWRKGIGIIAGDQLLKGNRHVALWASFWLDEDCAVGPSYPGSSWFAKEVCTQKGMKFEMSLWDVGTKPIADLKAHFSFHHNIFHRAAIADEPNIKNADFVFIDPPNKKEATWANIREVIRQLDPLKQSVLVWLPTCAATTCTPPAEDRMSRVYRDECLKMKMSASSVRWAIGGHVIGCQLLYRTNPDARQAIRTAVEAIEEAFIHAQLSRRKSPKRDACGGLLGVRHFDPV